MALDKLVDSTQLDSDLTDVADEIRTAGGTLLPLSFPDDYVVAIGDIGNTEIKTASGSIAHFEDALARKAQDLTVAIEPVQSGSGDPSPDNVRPISGWTGANVTRTGKNLLDTKSGKSTATSAGITAVKNADGSYNVTGTASGVVNLWLRGEWGNTTPIMKLYAGRTYYIKDVTPYNGTAGLSNSVNIGGSTTYTPSNDVFVTAIRATTPNGTTLNTVIYPYIGLVPYEEWQPFGDTYSIAFPSEAGTVYGGTLDVTTGKLTVDRAMKDLGTVNWYASLAAGYTRFWAHITDIARISSPNVLAPMLCSSYPTKTANQTYQGTTGISLQQNADNVYIYDAQRELMSAADFKSAMSGVQLCYELATPIVYDLDPVTVTTLLGTNNVWADTGDSTIKYIAPKAQIPSAQGVYF